MHLTFCKTTTTTKIILLTFQLLFGLIISTLLGFAYAFHFRHSIIPKSTIVLKCLLNYFRDTKLDFCSYTYRHFPLHFGHSCYYTSFIYYNIYHNVSKKCALFSLSTWTNMLRQLQFLVCVLFFIFKVINSLTIPVFFSCGTWFCILYTLVHRCFHKKIHLYDNWNVPNNFYKIKGNQTYWKFFLLYFSECDWWMCDAM